MNIAMTGASGFLGSRLVVALKVEHLVGIGRTNVPEMDQFCECSLNSSADFGDYLEKVDLVIHCAARAHIMKDDVVDPLAEYRSINVAGTTNLARQAARAGVKRFIFISSIKVNGEGTKPDRPFRESDAPMPEDAYGQSKWEAEQALQRLSEQTGMELVIIRPPLVYGPGVKGNFARLIALVAKGVPLPFGSVVNRRSLVGLDNLVDLIVTCTHHPDAANQVFIAGDGEDLSTAELVRHIAKALRRPARLVPFPAFVLHLAAKIIGKPELSNRLIGNLQVDISKAYDVLGWRPPKTVEEGLRQCLNGGG